MTCLRKFVQKSKADTDVILSLSPFCLSLLKLLTGTLDGKLRLFQSSTGSHLSHDTSAAVHCVSDVTV